MHRGWKIFPKQVGGTEQLLDEMSKLMRQFDYEFKVNYKTAKEIYQREVPGQVRRALRKEAFRSKERVRIRSIVSGIFAKNQIRAPTASVYDAGWINAKGKHED